MKIAFLNNSDLPGGGSSAVRLHRALRCAGCESRLGLLFQTDDEEGVECLGDSDRYAKGSRLLGGMISSAMAVMLRPQVTFCNDFVAAPTRRLLEFVAGADIIHLGMVANFVNSRQVRKLAAATRCPIVWTLNDHAPLTGGCHYTGGCNRFAWGCGRCPAIRSGSRFDLSAWTWRRKRSNLQGLNMGVVAASSSDELLVRMSPWTKGLAIERIPLPVDSERFKPLRSDIAREVLGIPKEGTVVFCGAIKLRDERKGFRQAIEATRIVCERRPELREGLTMITAGQGYSPQAIPPLLRVKHLGILRDERSLALAYQASDFLLSPSLMDSGPMMVLESLLCGTPVVAFPVGYAADLVNEHRLGHVAPLGDVLEFAEGIVKLIMVPEQERKEMRERCREVALSYCSPPRVASKYIAFYHKLLERKEQ